MAARCASSPSRRRRALAEVDQSERGRSVRRPLIGCWVGSSSEALLLTDAHTRSQTHTDQAARAQVNRPQSSQSSPSASQRVTMIRPLLMCFVFCVVYGSSKPTRKDRVHHDEELSQLEHDDDENYDFDHEAFLGHAQANVFAELKPEESKRRLSVIVDKMDTDHDEFVTEDELKVWIMHAQKKSVYDYVEKQWKDLDGNKDGFISWIEYKLTTHKSSAVDPQGAKDEARLLAKEERRFKVADKNGDMRADKEEFAAFLHPEEFSYMRGVVVKEAIEDMDKDQDGFVTVDEYLSDMYVPEAGQGEPDWLEEERRLFSESRDKNKDGKLDEAEVLQWILPDEDHVKIEAEHLMHEADENKDGKLTETEILDKYMVFVGSQVTNYGEFHDEF